jgi:hypothetical protein
MRKHVKALGLSLAALFVIMGAVLFGVLSAGAQVSPLCTTASQAALNAYWQGQVADATPATMSAVLSHAIAATAQRAKLCGEE